jgi:hypothetical protein
MSVVMLSACGGGEKSEEKKSGWTAENRDEFMKNCQNAISGYGDEISGKICDCALKEVEQKLTFEQVKNESEINTMQEIMFKCMEPYPIH